MILNSNVEQFQKTWHLDELLSLFVCTSLSATPIGTCLVWTFSLGLILFLLVCFFCVSIKIFIFQNKYNFVSVCLTLNSTKLRVFISWFRVFQHSVERSYRVEMISLFTGSCSNCKLEENKRNVELLTSFSAVIGKCKWLYIKLDIHD